jgi:hypothetical protein
VFRKRRNGWFPAFRCETPCVTAITSPPHNDIGSFPKLFPI